MRRPSCCAAAAATNCKESPVGMRSAREENGVAAHPGSMLSSMAPRILPSPVLPSPSPFARPDIIKEIPFR